MSLFRKSFWKKDSKENRFLDYEKRDIFIHPDSFIGSNCKIGYGTNINGPAYIASGKRCPVTIGKYCVIAHNFRARLRNYRLRNYRTDYINIQDKFQNRHRFPCLEAIKGPTSIGNNVCIADNITVLSGVTIGDGAVIGAGSVVTRSVSPYCISAGSPARLIKKRFTKRIISQLLEINWWDWSDEKIKRNHQLFETHLGNNEDIDLSLILVD